MIEFTTLTGAKVAINPMLVFAVQAGEGETMIVSAAGDVIAVKEAYSVVQRKLAGWAKA